jgi:type III secretion protein C
MHQAAVQARKNVGLNTLIRHLRHNGKLWLGRTGAALLAGSLLWGQAASAAPIPYGDHRVEITAKDMPIAEFLLHLFRKVGVQLVLSPTVKGVVSGNFEGPVEQVYGNLALAFNLVDQFDGTVLRIGTAQDKNEKPSAGDTARPKHSADPAVVAPSGDPKKPSRPAAASVATSARVLIPPDTDLPRAAPAPRPNNPTEAALDLRVFHLRRASAQDVTVGVGGRQVVLPGVAATVRAMMGSTTGNATKTTTPPTNDSQPRIEAHARLNAVLVRDLPQRMAHYEKLIALLDVEPQAIDIETTFIDFNTTRLRQLGFAWRYDSNKGTLVFGKGDAADITLTTTSAPNSAGGFASAVLASTEPFMARLQALQAQGLVKVTNNPQALTFSNVEAVLDNGQTFYLRPGRDESNPVNVAAGTTVRITPQVMQDAKEVRIKLTAAIDDRSLSNRVPGSPPVLNRASVSAQAVVFEGESLLVGGIIRDSLPDNLSPTPPPSSLLRNPTASPERVEPIERMVLISPRLVAARPAPPEQASTPATAPAVRPAPAERLSEPTPPPLAAREREQAVAALPKPSSTAPAATAVPPGRPALPAVATPDTVAPLRAPTQSVPPPAAMRLQDRRGPRETYLRGESYEIEVAVAERGFLYCYLLDVNQRIGQFFPNPQAPSAAVAAGSVLIFPGAFRFSLVAARQGGLESVVCLNSPKDLGSTPSLGTATDRSALQSRIERLAGEASGKVHVVELQIHAP